jgi:predicted DNA-binding transcriptional regulator YafY
LALLQGIRNGSIDPKYLPPDERRPLVFFLTAEGQSSAEIAHLFKRSDRTIERDIKALREEIAITKDPKLVEQMAGRLMCETELSIQRLRKVQRDKDASPADKIEAERTSNQIICQLIKTMQSLGYLPTTAQKIEADLTHRAASSLTLGEIQIEAGRLKQIQESLPAEEIKQADSAIEANETVTEFEDNSPQQDNNKGGNNHEPTK